MMGDQLILASDAISSWLIKNNRLDHNEFLKMILSTKKTRNDNVFSHWINTLRKKNEIKNDDTSLIFIELGEVDE